MIQSLKSFIGMFPRYTAYTIPTNAAQKIVDGRITSNGLESYRADSIIKQMSTLYADMYLHYRQDGLPQWLLFDTEVDICKSSIFDDSTNRTYISGLDCLRVFDDDSLDAYDTTINSDNSYKAAIPVPEAPLMEELDASSAVGSEETRVYVIAYARTWASNKIDLGDISSPAQTNKEVAYIDCKTDSTIRISDIKRDASLYDHRVNTVYIYRSAVDSSGNATFRYLIDFPLHPSSTVPQGVVYDDVNMTVSYTDTTKTDGLGEVPQNIGWSAPPDDIKGILALHNGVLVGYKKNTVYLSVPYQEHAWPVAYSYPSDYNIVGLGAYGNTVVVCTEAITYTLNASDPSLAYLTPIQDAHACVSKKSICSLDNACVYATNYGLVQITGNGATLLTKDLISDLEWVRLSPRNIQAAVHRGQYVMFWKNTATTDDNLYDVRGYVIDFVEPERGIIGLSQYVHCLYADPVDNTLYLMYKNSVVNAPVIAAFANTIYNKKAYTWTSKTFLDNTGVFNLSAGKINFHEGAIQITEQDDIIFDISYHPLNDTLINTYSINGDANTNIKNKVYVEDDWCVLSLYVDNTLRHTTKIYNNKPFRLPAGFRGDSYYVTLTSTKPITRVQVASSIGELE